MQNPNNNNNPEGQNQEETQGQDNTQETNPKVEGNPTKDETQEEGQDDSQDNPEPKPKPKKNIAKIKDKAIDDLKARLEAMEATIQSKEEETKTYMEKLKSIQVENSLKEKLPALPDKLKNLVLKEAKESLKYGEDGEVSNLDDVISSINQDYKEFIIDTNKPAGDIGGNFGNGKSSNGASISKEEAQNIIKRGNTLEIMKHQKDINYYKL